MDDNVLRSHMKRCRDSMNTTVHANCYNVDIALMTFGTWPHSNDSIIPMPINHGITSNYLARHGFYTSNWFTAKPEKAVVWCGNTCTVQHQLKNVSREKYQIKLVYSSPPPWHASQCEGAIKQSSAAPVELQSDTPLVCGCAGQLPGVACKALCCGENS